MLPENGDAIQPAGAAQARASRSQISSCPAARVLVLDDDPGIAHLECLALERAGYAVVCCSVADEAYSVFTERPPDLLVLDYRLGSTETGLDFYRRLRANGFDCPAVLVTGFSDEGRAIEALRAGFRDVVPKIGGYLDYLPEAIGRVLEQVSATRRLAETEAASKAKDHFLAVLSHELRTPLTPVLTAVQIMLADKDLPESLRDPLDVIRRNVELEAKLIDDLLDLTRVSRGKMTIHRMSTDVHEKLRNAIQIVDSDLRAKRISLRSELLARRTLAQADPARLQQIFWNLLKNAVKFTPEGGTVTIRSIDVPGDRIRLEFTDSGVGIEPELLPRIFNAFEQGGSRVTREFGGLGLGLNITRGLVELHGGTIAAQSRGKGHGATFVIELSTSLPEVAAPADVSIAVEQRSAPGVRILLVEDNADTSRLMARLLRHYGHWVATADSVTTALQTADAERFDVVVSDIGLPDGSGLDLMRQLLRRHPVRGIALSGFGMEEDVQRSKDAGFAEHLTKPIDPKLLHTVIGRVAKA